MSDSIPHVVVFRHPDAANEVSIFGDVKVLSLDGGSNFDASHLSHDDLERVCEWAAYHLTEAADAPEAVQKLVSDHVWSVLNELPHDSDTILHALAVADAPGYTQEFTLVLIDAAGDNVANGDFIYTQGLSLLDVRDLARHLNSNIGDELDGIAEQVGAGLRESADNAAARDAAKEAVSE